MPNITNICYGRGVGYKIEEIVLPKKIQLISATKIRKRLNVFNKKNKTDYLYFIHIPRTAGRYINSLFKQNDYELRYDDFTKIDRTTNREIPHLHKPHYRRYNVNRAPIFCIVRNPIDRFISAISTHRI